MKNEYSNVSKKQSFRILLFHANGLLWDIFQLDSQLDSSLICNMSGISGSFSEEGTENHNFVKKHQTFFRNTEYFAAFS